VTLTTFSIMLIRDIETFDWWETIFC